MVRIMGEYFRSYGPCIADGGQGNIWMLGTEFHHNLNSAGGQGGFYIDGSAWLDCCWSHDPNPYDYLIAEAAGDALYHRQLASIGNFQNGGGTLTTY